MNRGERKHREVSHTSQTKKTHVRFWHVLVQYKHVSQKDRSSQGEPVSYLHTVTDIIQRAVIDRFANVPHRPLGIGWCNDFMRAGGVLIGCEDADLPPRHFFFVDVHRLEGK